MVQEEVGQLGHGHSFLPQVRHGVVAEIETSHLRQPGCRKEQGRNKNNDYYSYYSLSTQTSGV